MTFKHVLFFISTKIRLSICSNKIPQHIYNLLLLPYIYNK